MKKNSMSYNALKSMKAIADVIIVERASSASYYAKVLRSDRLRIRTLVSSPRAILQICRF